MALPAITEHITAVKVDGEWFHIHEDHRGLTDVDAFELRNYHESLSYLEKECKDSWDLGSGKYHTSYELPIYGNRCLYFISADDSSEVYLPIDRIQAIKTKAVNPH